jgi:hypothetical protein
VLDDPEPWVLVNDLGTATVNLRIYFWLDGKTHSWLKVRSSVIRLVKRAFQEHGIEMPDEAREILFPQGVPVTVLPQPAQAGREAGSVATAERRGPAEASAVVSTRAEAGLGSEAASLKEQARQAKPLEETENLLEPTGMPGTGKSDAAP